ncbi:MFS transporter [Wolbachia endosymbiont (group B) of Endotricha flammealis]|uniref:MFS transporter n=1 Tax=Wolbachia endosymbiont (group B) of Endotricha flammealis TaxID=2954005 RepID=UPI00222FA286|nr:MFS transporter [Wolbachia endosymbiont (group B) of Endotricha flammealis]
MVKTNRLISNTNYINLVIADFISSLGDWMVIPIIGSLFFYDIGLSSQMLAIVEIIIAAPSVFFGSIIGVSVDNKNPIPILIYSDISRAVLSIILYFLAYHYEIVLLLLFLEGICRCFFLPSRQIALKVLVLNDLLPKASGFFAYFKSTCKNYWSSIWWFVDLVLQYKIFVYYQCLNFSSICMLYQSY